MPRAISATQRDPYTKTAFKYAEAVVAGRIDACHWVKAACQRSLDDYHRQATPDFPYVFDGAKGARVCQFVETLPHIEGDLRGRLIKLADWQTWLLVTVFAWLHDRGERAGKRRFRRIYASVSRGNGKSLITSAVALYMMLADGEGGAQVYAAAQTKKQAGIVFGVAKSMCRLNTRLCAKFGIKITAEMLAVQTTGSRFEALASDLHSLDGKNVFFASLDELHESPNRKVYDSMLTGCGKRSQPLLWIITTAGADTSGICYEQHEYVQKILDRVVEQDDYFGVIYTVDPDDDWQDPAIWKKANPNWGISVDATHVETIARQALTIPSQQSAFKTKHLGIWCQSDDPFFSMSAWAACADPALDVDDFAGQPAIIGLDLSSKIDMTAKVLLFQRLIDGEIHYYCFPTFYLPEETINDGRNSQYMGWKLAGYLKEIPGPIIDDRYIEDDIDADCRRFEVQYLGFDPWGANSYLPRLLEKGINALEVGQTTRFVSEPLKTLDAITRVQRFHYPENPVLLWMASNVNVHEDYNENVLARKAGGDKNKKKDGIDAIVNALALALTYPIQDSRYEPLVFALF